MSSIGKFTSGGYIRNMLDMRLRIPELMHRPKSEIHTAYALWKASRDKAPNGPRIPMSTAHRLVTTAGCVDRVDTKTLDALCIAFEVGPKELFTHEPVPEKKEKPVRGKRAR